MATWIRSSAPTMMTSPLGGDKLIPPSLSAYEAISKPFQFEVVTVSQKGVVGRDAPLFLGPENAASVARLVPEHETEALADLIFHLVDHPEVVVGAAEGARRNVSELITNDIVANALKADCVAAANARASEPGRTDECGGALAVVQEIDQQSRCCPKLGG